MDALLIRHYGSDLYPSPQALFKQFGEEQFSSWEIEILRSLTTENTIISLGGGTIMLEEAHAIVKQKGILIYLSLPLSLILERLQRRGLPERLKNRTHSTLQNRIDFMCTVFDYHFPMDGVDLSDTHSLHTACKHLHSLLLS